MSMHSLLTITICSSSFEDFEIEYVCKKIEESEVVPNF
jgi:hypothetical protein